MKEKLLVIGGSGFIGSNIIENFKYKKIELHSTYFKTKPKIKRKIKYIKINLNNFNSVSKILQNYDYVFMCAGKIFNKRRKLNKKFITENVKINLNVIESICKSKVKKFIWFNSCTGYPESNKFLKEKDFFKKKPSFHKISGNQSRYIEKYLKTKSKIINTQIITIRVPEVFGKYDNFDFSSCRNIPLIINTMFKKKNKKISLDLNIKKSYIFASDLAKISIKIFFKNKKKFQTFNVCNDKPYSLIHILSIIRKIWYKKSFEYIENNNLKLVNISRKFSNKKIKRFLKIKRMNNLKSSIHKTILWYKKFYKI